MVPPRLQHRMVSSVAGEREFGVGHFGCPKGRAWRQIGLKNEEGTERSKDTFSRISI